MDIIISALDHIAISRYVAVGGAALWAYEYLITCVDEYTRIWPSKRSVSKVLYFGVSLVNRVKQSTNAQPFQVRYTIGFYLAIMVYSKQQPVLSQSNS